MRDATAETEGAAAVAPAVQLSPAERAARGKAARAEVPRGTHGEWAPAPGRPDPIELLEQQAATRVPELVPIRYGRMLVSPFTFYRGGALIMASDLAATPRSGLHVQLCGDAHLSNFGVFGTPERNLVFDINDFDETYPGPWEWDLKRLTASLVVAGRDRGYSAAQRGEIVLAAAEEYGTAMRGFAGKSNLEVWYARVDIESAIAGFRRQLSARQLARGDAALAKARTKDRLRSFSKLTEVVDGKSRIISDPPLIVPIDELMGSDWQGVENELRSDFRDYRITLESDRRQLLERYQLAHVARKVVGVGSVGTRAWIALLIGRDASDPVFLQIKEAQPSVLEPFLGSSAYDNCGQRVVAGQRLMQTASDLFLGWLRREKGLDGRQRDFYVRQLSDWKGSAEIDVMRYRGMVAYGRLCAWTLARAHARSGDSIAIASYVGAGHRFHQAIAAFSEAYADQNERDYSLLVDAVKSGRLEATTGL
ncbi:MAG TPA: DUF2252 domain-containing protein [Gaiellales bacterium]|nr:DUF2252 domain-containing protein [Gaiellales bacterium]